MANWSITYWEIHDAQNKFWWNYNHQTRNSIENNPSLARKVFEAPLNFFRSTLMKVLEKKSDSTQVENTQKLIELVEEPVVQKKQLNENYSIIWNQVFFREKLIWWADPKTFESPFSDIWYTRDENHVYFKWRKITWADPKTFHFIQAKNWEESVYATDKTNRIYDLWIARNYDFNSFVVLSKLESYDKYGIYFWEEKLRITDLKDQKRIREKYDVKVGRFGMAWNSFKRNIFWD